MNVEQNYTGSSLLAILYAVAVNTTIRCPLQDHVICFRACSVGMLVRRLRVLFYRKAVSRLLYKVGMAKAQTTEAPYTQVFTTETAKEEVQCVGVALHIG